MTTPLDWQLILLGCKNSIQTAIGPYLSTVQPPQEDLGRGAGGDVMKPVDLAAEKAIIQTLQAYDVSFTLISEESGVKKFGSAPKDCYICVDPIDGTTNFVHGLPFYASSIAVACKPNLEGVFAGIVVDLVHDDVFYAYRGKGAYRNGKQIHTSNTKSIDDAIIGLDLNAYKAQFNKAIAANLIESIRHTRHFGANALEISHVAAGLTDAFIDLRGKIRATDVAAGFLIAKEAGAVITDADGNPINVPLDPRQTLAFIASANMNIHKHILSLINRNV